MPNIKVEERLLSSLVVAQPRSETIASDYSNDSLGLRRENSHHLSNDNEKSIANNRDRANAKFGRSYCVAA